MSAQRRIDTIRIDARRGRSLDLPVIRWEGGAERPLAVITANVHGDEVTGLGVVRALDDWLRRHPPKGTLWLVPSCNPRGLSRQLRQVPADEVDLNRVFPGNRRGTRAQRVAAALWRELKLLRPDLLIDLHADAARALPYVIVDRPVRLPLHRRRDLSARLLRLAEATGLTVLREYPDDVYTQFGLDRSLAGAVVNLLGVPAITLEVGPRRVMDDAAVRVALKATLAVLDRAGLVEAPARAVDPGRIEGAWRRASGPRARRAGLVDPLVAVGSRVRAGDPLARIVDLTGEHLETILATRAGVVVSWVDSPWVEAGGVLGTFGVADEEAL